MNALPKCPCSAHPGARLLRPGGPGWGLCLLCLAQRKGAGSAGLEMPSPLHSDVSRAAFIDYPVLERTNGSLGGSLCLASGTESL